MQTYRLKGAGKIYISSSIGYGTIGGKNVMGLLGEAIGTDDDFYGEIEITVRRFDEGVTVTKDEEEEACAE